MYISRSISGSRLTSGQARVGGMFHIKPRVKIHFFDRSIIRSRWKRFNKDPLMMAGMKVMKNARQSIKRRKKNIPSPPGQPPRSHAPGAVPPFKQIYFQRYNIGTSVIVGMVGYTRVTNPPPGLQEHGGIARRKVFARLGQRRMKSGRFGKIAYSYKPAMVKYPQRPFMMPALMRTRQRFPELWRGSLT